MNTLEQVKVDIVTDFIKYAKDFQRVNKITELYKDLIYNEGGFYIDGGRDIANFIDRLDKTATYLESRVDYSILFLID